MVGRETYNAVKAALQVGFARPERGMDFRSEHTIQLSLEPLFLCQNGYRLIDTAEWYGNEEETGECALDDQAAKARHDPLPGSILL